MLHEFCGTIPILPMDLNTGKSSPNSLFSGIGLINVFKQQQSFLAIFERRSVVAFLEVSSGEVRQRCRIVRYKRMSFVVCRYCYDRSDSVWNEARCRPMQSRVSRPFWAIKTLTFCQFTLSVESISILSKGLKLRLQIFGHYGKAIYGYCNTWWEGWIMREERRLRKNM